MPAHQPWLPSPARAEVLHVPLLPEATPALTLAVPHPASTCQLLKNKLPVHREVSSPAPKPHLLLLLFSPFHYPFLFARPKAFRLETEELCGNLPRRSVPIFSAVSDARKAGALLAGGVHLSGAASLGMRPGGRRWMPPSRGRARARFGVPPRSFVCVLEAPRHHLSAHNPCLCAAEGSPSPQHTGGA